MNSDESNSKKYEALKTKNFKKNDKLNNILLKLKEILEPQQRMIQEEYQKTKWPVGLIVGAPRSGTTILMQYLASLNCFSYPSNLLTRFAYAPYVGALIQKMLFDPDYDFHGDFYDIQSGVNFKSDLGKSKGALATNEFQHFFRNFMPNFDPKYLEEEELRKVDTKGIASGLGSIESAFGKPFITKGFLLQFNLEYFFYNIPNLFIIYIKRHPIMNMQSIYLSREKYYGTKDIWVSVRPKEYKILKELDVFHQIAGQIFYTEKSIEIGLENIPQKNKMIINYEDFCRSPESIYRILVKKYNLNGYKIDDKYKGPEKFEISNKKKIPSDTILKFEKAYDFFINKHSGDKN